MWYTEVAMLKHIPTTHASVLLVGIVVVLLGIATQDVQPPLAARLPDIPHPVRRAPRLAPPAPALASLLPTVSVPQPDAAIQGMIAIRGAAPGPWFFEGSFPITLVDENGAVVARITAEAQGDWMTVGDVPFAAQLEVPHEVGGPGVIILEKNNPSGLPDKNASFGIPVVMLRDTTPRTDL